MIIGQPGQQFEATYEGDTGRPNVGVRVVDAAGATVVARAVAAELVAGSGIYSKQVTVAASGNYVVVWDDAGTAWASEELTVTPAGVLSVGGTGRRPRALATLAEVKLRIRNYSEPTDPAEQTNADMLLLNLIDSASDRIYEVAGREFLSALDPGTQGGNDWPAPPTETRIFDQVLNPNLPGGGAAAAIAVGDMQALTSVGVSYVWATAGITPFDLALDPYVRPYPSPRQPGKPIRRLTILGGVREQQRYHVVGKWGWPAVPMAIRQAAQEQAAIWASDDLARWSETFRQAAQAGTPVNEPRALAQSVYDTALLYRIPSL